MVRYRPMTPFLPMDSNTVRKNVRWRRSGRSRGSNHVNSQSVVVKTTCLLKIGSIWQTPQWFRLRCERLVRRFRVTFVRQFCFPFPRVGSLLRRLKILFLRLLWVPWRRFVGTRTLLTPGLTFWWSVFQLPVPMTPMKFILFFGNGIRSVRRLAERRWSGIRGVTVLQLK